MLSLKKATEYKLIFKSKPGLQKSILVKDKLLTNFIKNKDPNIKVLLHLKNKSYRNLLSTL